MLRTAESAHWPCTEEVGKARTRSSVRDLEHPTFELFSISPECKRRDAPLSLADSVVTIKLSWVHCLTEALYSVHHLLVATPGRLVELLATHAVTLERVTLLTIDEADRMMDLGFEEQLNTISEAIRPDRQTLLFSATFPYAAKANQAQPSMIVLSFFVRECVDGAGLLVSG